MKYFYSVIFILVAIAANAQTYNGPESVEFDVANNRWLIGNTGSHAVIARDSVGTLTNFVTGLVSGPYGIEIVGDTLFCCCGSSIKGYKLSTGTLVFNLNVGASFLNGMTHDNAGNLIATDFSAKSIYKVNIAAQTDTVITSAMATTPNGIVFDEANNRCVFINWGSNAPVKAISMSTYAVTTVIATTLSNCDGITRDGQGRYYISNWGNQTVVRYDSGFISPPVTVATSLSSPADIFYDQSHDILGVPNSGNNTVTFVDFNTTGIEIALDENLVSVYPNPASDYLEFQFKQTDQTGIVISDLRGRVVYEADFLPADNGLRIGLDKFKNGKYFYEISVSGKKQKGSFVVVK